MCDPFAIEKSLIYGFQGVFDFQNQGNVARSLKLFTARDILIGDESFRSNGFWVGT